MARKPRLHVPGGLYHAILRGNARQQIFFDDADRTAFYALVDEATRRFEIRVHAFCLMTNHVHLAVQVGTVALSRPLQNLAFRYARYVNHKRGRVGHLFQGRYQAMLVDSDNYLLELARYIHLNPVRARLVADPVDYVHSSHLDYLGRRSKAFLTTSAVLSHFSERIATARRRYAAFVAEGVGDGHRPDLHVGAGESRVIGADSFVEQVMNAAPDPGHERTSDLPTIIRRVCIAEAITEDALARSGKSREAARARAMIAWLAMQMRSASLTILARRFGRDLSVLSRSVARLDRELARGDRAACELRARLIAISQA